MNPPSTPTFESLGLSSELLEAVRAAGFASPTPVQAACIPALLAGRDVVGQSRTGSGKTAAFGLPLLQAIDLERREVQALVLCPTRELASQVARELRGFGAGLGGLTVLELTGGQPARPQREALERGVHLAVGTPGRVQDHLQNGSLHPRSLRHLVLDEADRMLDMGFGPDVRRIVKALPTERRTALFSATFPTSIEEMSRSLQKPDALRVEIEAETAESPAELRGVRQLRCASTPDLRFASLCRLLVDHPHESVIVFCNFKASVAELTEALRRHGVSADRLDGDLDQFHRDQVLARFRNGSIRTLVATDVAGRGIDIDGLDLVINYELPSQPEIYVHRIGRTGRAGKTGTAISLVKGTSDPRIDAIEELTGLTVEPIALDPKTLSNVPAMLATLAGPPPMATILISGGRKDKVRRGDILGALTGEEGALKGSDVGKIEVQDRLSYVAVTEHLARAATARMNKGKIKGKRYRATLIL
ncbi:ATP-dependent RNA helicase DbpA [Planctomycetes bacterium Poly30]|uniref:ATP-dependent RNA helicase DbpA n=1 Tax=Saltatorellus ferox TaxID=2528018 RepID=A0A518EKF1_9BACT|nr:ATP-dependent RNA helicase DbpA [Planctomycetes bacterium Poly30]